MISNISEGAATQPPVCGQDEGKEVDQPLKETDPALQHFDKVFVTKMGDRQEELGQSSNPMTEDQQERRSIGHFSGFKRARGTEASNNSEKALDPDDLPAAIVEPLMKKLRIASEPKPTELAGNVLDLLTPQKQASTVKPAPLAALAETDPAAAKEFISYVKGILAEAKDHNQLTGRAIELLPFSQQIDWLLKNFQTQQRLSLNTLIAKRRAELSQPVAANLRRAVNQSPDEIECDEIESDEIESDEIESGDIENA